MDSTVSENVERQRFELMVEGYIAFATYRREGTTIAILHTEVPKELGGRGIASKLVRGLLNIARAQGLRVNPLCPFVKTYIERHEEYADLTFLPH
jgi:predicted GNAT family acetyltransferase